MLTQYQDNGIGKDIYPEQSSKMQDGPNGHVSRDPEIMPQSTLLNRQSYWNRNGIKDII